VRRTEVTRSRTSRALVKAAASQQVAALFESLEARRLLAGYPLIVQNLPFSLDFSNDRGRLVDKDRTGTGFTWVQPNAAGDEYQPDLIDLNRPQGVLRITSAGNSHSGSNYGSDNSLVNGLQTSFDSTLVGGFTITTRLLGPLTQFDRPSDQAGLMFGPDSDNYVKVVATATTNGPVLQFLDEQNRNTHTLGGSGATISIGRFSDVTTLDLTLSGDARAGVMRAFYSLNGGPQKTIDGALNILSALKSKFFSRTARAGLIVSHKNDSAPPMATFDSFSITAGVPMLIRPTVRATRPGRSVGDVARDGFVAVDVVLPTAGAGIDPATLTRDSVKLIRVSDGRQVSAVLNTSAGGDAIVLQPTSLLDANTTYRFEVNERLADLAGASFVPYSSTFTTGTRGGNEDPSIAFEQVSLPTAQDQSFSAVTIGPDHRLYAASLSGHIFRWDIRSDGTLGAQQVINTVRNANGGSRFITGIVFDPASTPDNLVLWVTNGEYAFENASDWTGKLSRLSGANLEQYQDYIVGLPRSIRDHLTNQAVFGPDGKLYVAQGSMSAMGAPDNPWGLRSEHLLNAAILVVDTKAIGRRIAAGDGPLDVRTEGVANPYDPFNPGNPLQLFATGVRNAYDLVFHSNGSLYAPTNGSAAGGNTPALVAPYPSTPRIDSDENGPYGGPNVPGLKNVAQTQPDYLFRIQQGGYYGHPNPTRGEYVLNGGNPAPGGDPNEVSAYPVGTQPDRNYRGSVYTFGTNYSPDGVIEYHGIAFGGKLNGRLLICRYSGGDDVISLDVNSDGSVGNARTSIAGLSHFVDPLDITEDIGTGFLYVVEHGANRITLCRPLVGASAVISTNASLRVFSDPRGGAPSPSRRITITNTGKTALAIQSDGINIVGPDASQFDIISTPVLPITIPVGQSVSISVAFNPSTSTSPGVKTATLHIASNDPNTPVKGIALRGLATKGLAGKDEPSLQRILDLYQIKVNVGDKNPNDVKFDVPPKTPNDEITAPRLLKAGPGPVTVEPLAVFSVSSSPTMQFGTYQPGSPQERTELFSIGSGDSQTVSPTPNGATSFDPGSAMFSLYTVWPKFTNGDGSTRVVYGEDVLNTWESKAIARRKVRVYRLTDAAGKVVPHALVVAFEEFTRDYDNQDFVAILRNVKPAPAGGEIGTQTLDGGPAADRAVMSRVQRADAQVPNGVHDSSTVRIWNTGNRPLQISSMSLSNPGAFRIINVPKFPLRIEHGRFYDLHLQFKATGGAGTQNARLTLNSDDRDERARVIRLTGYWQNASGSVEPTLPALGALFGYNTAFVHTGQSLNTGGRVQAIGDEMLSAYWMRSDASLPVTVQQLWAYHTQGNSAGFYWYNKGTGSDTKLFSSLRDDGQTVFPRMSASTGSLARGTFSPGNVPFGFRIDNERSDDRMNKQEHGGGGWGHHLRFFPVRDKYGSFVPNAWIVAQNYGTTGGFAYNDNGYLITNIRPESRPAAPEGAAAVSHGGSVMLDWAAATGGAAGYNVYRSTSVLGKYARLNSSPIAASIFNDTKVTDGMTYYYRIMAVDSTGQQSSPTDAFARA
jgi:glucose/arabinose dehydrogenase